MTHGIHKRVLLYGESSDYVPGVPQGTVLGPLMFLIYTSSQLRLFANDCLLHHAIKTEQDSILLQQDLDALSQLMGSHFADEV